MGEVICFRHHSFHLVAKQNSDRFLAAGGCAYFPKVVVVLDLQLPSTQRRHLHLLSMIGNCIRRQAFASSFHASRSYATQAALAATPKPVQYPYYIARNTMGSLPVYTEFKNAGARCQILIRNVEGDVNVCASMLIHASVSLTRFQALIGDIREELVQSEEAGSDMSYLSVEVVRSKHLVLHGARPRMKNEVISWLKERGF